MHCSTNWRSHKRRVSVTHAVPHTTHHKDPSNSRTIGPRPSCDTDAGMGGSHGGLFCHRCTRACVSHTARCVALHTPHVVGLLAIHTNDGAAAEATPQSRCRTRSMGRGRMDGTTAISRTCRTHTLRARRPRRHPKTTIKLDWRAHPERREQFFSLVLLGREGAPLAALAGAPPAARDAPPAHVKDPLHARTSTHAAHTPYRGHMQPARTS